jgi:glutaredoxin
MVDIIFASMDGCGFCNKAKEALKEHIDSNEVMVVTPEEGQKYGLNGNGYPQFLSKKTGKKTMGFRDLNKLMDDLGHSNNEDSKPSSSKNNKIIFASMDGCGFCNKAMEMLKELIDNGTIEVRVHTESNSQFFPHFENSANGATYSGLPNSIQELMQKLGASPVENYRPMDRRVEYYMPSVRTSPEYIENFHFPTKMMGGYAGVV